MKVEEIKKVELHLHLDGSVKPATLSKIKNISLDKITFFEVLWYYKKVRLKIRKKI